MSSNYEHTTKFKADISSLKQGITQANKELKKIASEYKAASSAAELSGKEQDKLKVKFDYLTKALEQQNKKLQSYKDQLKVTQDYTKKLGDKEQELTKKLEDAKNKFGANSTEVQKYQKELTAVQKEITSNKDKIDKLNVTINNQQAICNNTEKELNDYTKALQDLQDSSQQANQGADDLGDGLGGISDAVTAASSALDSLGGIVDGLTDKFENLLINGIKAVAEGVKALATNAFESGITFESAMSQVVATMGLEKASEDYEKLSEIAKKYGAETKFTATQAAEALNYLALAGYKTDEAIELLPTVLNLAIAGGMDLASASDMVTDAMSALGLEMDEATRFTDELARTAQNSNTSVEQLGNAILTIGATARGMENGTSELSTALGVLANSSYKGEEGGTKLRNILLALQGPTDDAAALMDELGIKVYDVEGNMRGVNDIFMDLQKSMNGFSAEEVNNVMNTLFNVRDVGAAKYLLSACGEEFDNLFTKVSSCEGAADDMATTMSDNLEGSMYSLESAIEGIGIAFYDKLQTPARSVIDSITLTIRNLINEITNGEGLSGALDIISNSMTGFAESLPGLVEKHLPTLQQCFLGISQIIATLIDYLPYLIDTCLPKLLDIINKVLSSMPDFMENTLPKIIDMIGWVIENLPTLLTILYGIKGILAILKTVLAALGIGALISKLGALFGAGGVLASVGSVVGGVISTLGSFGGAILTLIGHTAGVIAFFEGIYAICLKIVGFFTGKNIKYENPIERLKKSFEGFSLENIKTKFDELGTKIKDFVNSIPVKIEEFKNNTIEKFKEMGDNISTKFEEIGNKIAEFFENLPETIGYWLGFIVGQISSFFVNTWNNLMIWIDETGKKINTFFSELPTKIETWFNETLEKISTFVANAIMSAIEWVDKTGEKISTFFSELPGKIEAWFNETIDKVVTWGNNLYDTATTWASDTIDAIIDYFKGLPSKMEQAGKDIVDGLVGGLKNKWQDVKNTVGDFVSGIKEGFTDGFDIHSPSRWMKNFIGKNMMEGLELGITTNESSLFNTLKDLNDGIKSSFNLDNVQLGLASATGSINSSGSSNIVNNSTSSNVNYNPVFNYNKPLNSREIYRQNKNMLGAALGI